MTRKSAIRLLAALTGSLGVGYGQSFATLTQPKRERVPANAEKCGETVVDGLTFITDSTARMEHGTCMVDGKLIRGRTFILNLDDFAVFELKLGSETVYISAAEFWKALKDNQ